APRSARGRSPTTARPPPRTPRRAASAPPGPAAPAGSGRRPRAAGRPSAPPLARWPALRGRTPGSRARNTTPTAALRPPPRRRPCHAAHLIEDLKYALSQPRRPGRPRGRVERVEQAEAAGQPEVDAAGVARHALDRPPRQRPVADRRPRRPGPQRDRLVMQV